MAPATAAPGTAAVEAAVRSVAAATVYGGTTPVDMEGCAPGDRICGVSRDAIPTDNCRGGGAAATANGGYTAAGPPWRGASPLALPYIEQLDGGAATAGAALVALQQAIGHRTAAGFLVGMHDQAATTGGGQRWPGLQSRQQQELQQLQRPQATPLPPLPPPAPPPTVLRLQDSNFLQRLLMWQQELQQQQQQQQEQRQQRQQQQQ
ncbi:hypothetical protein PLESTB_001797400 [Pleodorina starrii]|uniref:Uncharacterized protein n=1 Tax=Pleodorina starrii TaxID=330485 RepID=A0A9W6F9U0_9CHLO|nr:hypothetical protein PLESTM_001161800 [Pleodorina starrii]GLC61737.1 hypothetical protein PLESTB_001797400 [Pleodorina starrii]GLC69217.1 hypothetical protein PLESTF_000803100 [Pleodorina starrii]